MSTVLSDRPTVSRYPVAVRALCEFTARRGDLDLRFTPSATALEGIAGHQLVASRREPGYEAELTLGGECENLLLRGRADGYDPRANRLDEVKTYRGDLDAMPHNRRTLHWAQARVYAALLCRERALSHIDVALVYFDVVEQTETVLVEPCTAIDLEAFLVDQCRRFSQWAAQELVHRAARDTALRELRFAHPQFRTGQRELSEAVYRAALNGRCLIAQAPTGIGKTIGTLFPMLKAWPERRLDKLFFLTAKTPGRGLALDALATLRRGAPALPLRVIELVARDKACEHPGKACHGESCPLAQGFFDRLPAARADALGSGGATLDRPALRTVALAHQVCPYHLGQELVRWADVVVGDYNHYFDTSALLHGMTLGDNWRVGVLVDEAHNLVDRARAMYSAELRLADLRALSSRIAAPLRPALTRLTRTWQALDDAAQSDHEVHDELPVRLFAALQSLSAAIGEHMADGRPAQPRREPDPALLRVWFDLLHFLRLNDSRGDHSLIDHSRSEADDSSAWNIRNVVPAPFVKPRLRNADSVVLFSATLRPAHYHRDLLGVPEDALEIDVASPFTAEQLQVRIAGAISTRLNRRGDSIGPIVSLMKDQFARRPGNYLAFFSSYDYLQQVAERLAQLAPELPQWRQDRAMSEAARGDFLARFTADGRGVGFAVLGGAFAEAIDLPGTRLIGAFIATLGLPQVNPVNQQVRERIERCFGTEHGHDYTYLYPGLQKVVQAAGRVIRTPQDRGVVWLIDDRYGRPSVRRLLPSWWRIEGDALAGNDVVGGPSGPMAAQPPVYPG